MHINPDAVPTDHVQQVWSVASADLNSPTWCVTYQDDTLGVRHLDWTHASQFNDPNSYKVPGGTNLITTVLPLDTMLGLPSAYCSQCLSLFKPSLVSPSPVTGAWLRWAMPLADAIVHSRSGLSTEALEVAILDSLRLAPDGSAATTQLLDRALYTLPPLPAPGPLRLVSAQVLLDDPRIEDDWCVMTRTQKPGPAPQSLTFVLRGLASGFLLNLNPGLQRLFAGALCDVVMALPEQCVPQLDPAGFTLVDDFGPIANLNAAKLLASEAVGRADGGRALLQSSIYMN